jgi:hypothetical protein
MQDYHQLKVWQRAMNYAVEIYKFTSQLPGDERYNLTVQLRKAVVSVPLNIAKGAGSATPAEFSHFLSYARYEEPRTASVAATLTAGLNTEISTVTAGRSRGWCLHDSAPRPQDTG